jgi:hypothetical protein
MRPGLAAAPRYRKNHTHVMQSPIVAAIRQKNNELLERAWNLRCRRVASPLSPPQLTRPCSCFRAECRRQTWRAGGQVGRYKSARWRAHPAPAARLHGACRSARRRSGDRDASPEGWRRGGAFAPTFPTSHTVLSEFPVQRRARQRMIACSVAPLVDGIRNCSCKTLRGR